jgi:hypothetical protein
MEFSFQHLQKGRRYLGCLDAQRIGIRVGWRKLGAPGRGKLSRSHAPTRRPRVDQQRHGMHHEKVIVEKAGDPSRVRSGKGLVRALNGAV